MMDWQVPEPHSPFAPLVRTDGVQINAQYFEPVVVCRAHCGAAVTPLGTSLGQLMPEHGGEQKSPETPCTRTACSSLSQPPAGSP